MLMFDDYNLQAHHNWSNKWEIRSHWDGELIDKNKLTSLDPDTIRYYLKPFFLFSIIPQKSIKWGQVMKLYVGFDFKTWKNKVNNKSLEIMYSLFGFNYGISINDKLEKGCSQILQDANGQAVEYVNQRILRQKWLNFKRINWKKPILIPLKCLNKDKKNFIKIWWSAKSNKIFYRSIANLKNNVFLKDTTRVKIDFFYPKKHEIYFQINKKQNFRININYWYLIENQLKDKSKTIPILSKQIELISEIKNKYKNSQPFQTFYKLIYKPINVNLNNWKLILKYFYFKNLENDFSQLQNWNKPQNIIKTETQVENNLQKHNISGIIQETNKKKITIDLTIKNYRKQIETSKNINFYEYSFSQKNITKNYWNVIQKKIIENNFSSNTFLSGWSDIKENVILINTFLWNNISSIKIHIMQKTQFENLFWNKSISLKKIERINAQKNTKEENFLINVSDLRKIAFENEITFRKYWILRKKWQKNYEKKNFNY